MKNVIIPTDFSANARNALAYILGLYGIRDTQIMLVNSFEAPNAAGSGMLVSIDDIVERESKKDLKREERLLREKYPEIQLDTHSIYGHLEDVLNKLVSKHHPDLVVMGTQGASGLKEVLIGSNTQRVIQRATFPVLAIPEKSTFSSIDKVVLATDLKALDGPEVLSTLVDLLKLTGAHLHVVHVEESASGVDMEEEQNRIGLTSFLGSLPHSYHLVIHDDVIEGVDDFVLEVDADLLVTIPREVSFWDKLFKRSVSKQFAYHTKVPLLALKYHE